VEGEGALTGIIIFSTIITYTIMSIATVSVQYMNLDADFDSVPEHFPLLLEHMDRHHVNRADFPAHEQIHHTPHKNRVVGEVDAPLPRDDVAIASELVPLNGRTPNRTPRKKAAPHHHHGETRISRDDIGVWHSVFGPPVLAASQTDGVT